MCVCVCVCVCIRAVKVNMLTQILLKFFFLLMFFMSISHLRFDPRPARWFGKSEGNTAAELWWQQKWIKKKKKGLLIVKFSFTALPDGSPHKDKVICVYCRCEMSCPCTMSSIKYHLLAERTADAESPPSSCHRQAALLCLKQMQHGVFYYENESDVTLFIRCVTSCLLCAEYGWVDVQCSGIQQK